MRLRSPRDTWASTAVQTWESTMTPADLDALVARLKRDSIRINGAMLLDEAAAALAELRDSEALARGKIAELELAVKMIPLPEVREDTALINRIAALEAEREAANERAGKHLADFYDMRNQRDALKAALRKWAVSRHTNKCYICDWSWSEGAPQIHSAKCLCYGGADNDN